MKIRGIFKDEIYFDNGKRLTFQFNSRAIPFQPMFDLININKECFEIEFEEEGIQFDVIRFVGLLIRDVKGKKCVLPMYKTDNPSFDKEFYNEILGHRESDEDRVDLDLCMDTLFRMVNILYSDKKVNCCCEKHFQPLNTVYQKIVSHVTEPMYITEVTEEYIQFSNRRKIEYGFSGHDCEDSYADFLQVDELGRIAAYYEDGLIFEAVDGLGFYFGNVEGTMTFVPCFSKEKGRCTSELDIYYNGDMMIRMNDGNK